MGGGTFWALAEETAHQRPESVLLADGHGRVRSEPQRPQAVTRSSSSPGPGDGSGTATTSYRPSAPTTAARTTPPTGSDLAAAAAGRAAAAMSGGAHRRWRPALAVRLDRLDDRLPVFEGLVADLDVERGRVAELQHLHALRPGGVGVGRLGEDEEAVAGLQDPAAHVGLTGDDVVQAVGRVAVAGQPVARREAHVHEAEAVRSLALEQHRHALARTEQAQVDGLAHGRVDFHRPHGHHAVVLKRRRILRPEERNRCLPLLL